MEKIISDIPLGAIIIVLLALSISLSPASARPDPIDAENVIITPPKLYEQAKSLKDFHNSTVSTDVVNTTWIYSNYENASDSPYEGYKNSSLTGWGNINGYNYSLAKRIINYTSDTAEHPNLTYVTLFGNARLVPPSYYVYIDHGTDYDDWIPTDFFYASPDYDTFPNYMVGRLSVNNTEEAEHVVQKIKNWDGNKSSGDWFKNVSLAGGQPSGSDYYYGEMIITDSINRDSFNGMNITKLFKTDGNFTEANIKNVFSGNVGMFYLISHGTGKCIYSKDYAFYICPDDLPTSSNPKVPVVVSSACLCGAFDTDLYNIGFETSFGEGVLLSNASGIAYIGGARKTHAKPSFSLDEGYLTITNESYMGGMLTYVFEAYHNGSTTLGNITKAAIEKFVAENDFSHTYDNATLFEFVLLGDPALELPSQESGDSYQQPNSIAVNPEGYVDNIPWYNTNTNITVNSTTNSSRVYTKRIDTIANTVVERRENSTVGGAFNYTFTSSIETEYLVRTASEDGKEGWLYLKVFLSVHNRDTSENFSTIQAAIYDSDTKEGDIIEVDRGTYEENVKVNKSLTIQSTSGNPADTIVQATDSNDHVFEVTANYVNISGFTVKGATGSGNAGIYLGSGVDHGNISNNKASNNYDGICLNYSSNNTLTNNTVFSNSRHGFYLYNNADYNNITCNYVHNNSHGFHLEDNSTYNNISYNNIITNGEYNSSTGGYEWNFYNNQSDNVSATNNYWGTDNATIINASIYDYYDNSSKGVVIFTPRLTKSSPCAPIPELPTIILLSIGLLALAGYGWLRRKKKT